MTAEGSSTPAFEEVRRRRAELREAMGELENAIAAPAVDNLAEWTDGVRTALAQLREDFATHLAVTEGPGGLHEELVVVAPRLVHAVDRLTLEHATIGDAIGTVSDRLDAVTEEADADGVRDEATDLLVRLARHRQRGSDLLWQAYSSDVGGET